MLTINHFRLYDSLKQILHFGKKPLRLLAGLKSSCVLESNEVAFLRNEERQNKYKGNKDCSLLLQMHSHCRGVDSPVCVLALGVASVPSSAELDGECHPFTPRETLTKSYAHTHSCKGQPGAKMYGRPLF